MKRDRRWAISLYLALAGGLAGVYGLMLPTGNGAQIPKPDDAPPPLSPAESLKKVSLPAGFRLELIASEPLVREPSGVCWDERGRMFVCELHGYNLEGQYDIEELNKTGKLDREVRRIGADEAAVKKAAAETYGTVKMLVDRDGDGRMDEAVVWAERLPPCYGVCPARGGIIVVGAPEIVFLADRDNDGKADVREVLFSGFEAGALERGINCPMWGLDDWIYVGGGHNGGTITGPRLAKPVALPNSDFRIKADGSAIEPITGRTHTIGHAMTAAGERFVTTTNTPGMFIAPIDWRYLARNPNVATGRLEINAASDGRAYPTSAPHPWRTKRSTDPGFSKFYTDRYGVSESAPNGYFTSACSPMVYHGSALPGLDGQLLTCEPAQNFVHRAVIERDGVALRLSREKSETEREFLASADPWFHPIALATAPDGTVCVVDFYREIIEDYSAIPRYLQQQYGLVNGREHGRLWRLVHESTARGASADMSALSGEQLLGELDSDNAWRRRTAQRLIGEQQLKGLSPKLARLARAAKRPATVLAALYSLDGLGALASHDVMDALKHADATGRVHGLRLGERFVNSEVDVFEKMLSMVDDPAAEVRLQAVLSLGESRQPEEPVEKLAAAARAHGNERWMDAAILSSLSGLEGKCLVLLLKDESTIGNGAALVEPLARAVTSRGKREEISEAVFLIALCNDSKLRTSALHGLVAGSSRSRGMQLSATALAPLHAVTADPTASEATKKLAYQLIRTWRTESADERAKRISRAAKTLGNVQQDVDFRLEALAEIADDDDAAATAAMIGVVASSTPQLRSAVLKALFARGERLAAVLDAIERGTIPAAAIDAVQRSALLEHKNKHVRTRARKVFDALPKVDDAMLAKFVAALDGKRDIDAGGVVFRNKCATCHEAHGVGVAVGPDLTAEFQRAESTIVKDILAPSDSITAGYSAYAVETVDGEVVNGLLAHESASSLTLRLPEGKEQTILRKDVEQIKALGVSLMPENLAKELTPAQVADAIAWLRQPPSSVVLVDENRALEQALDQGEGTAQFVGRDRFAGSVALEITPPQKFSPKINGWAFKIREKPGPGEFRYLRMAWKTDGATGVMLELANGGRWPDARSKKFRYFAGENTSGWSATRVAEKAPQDWTVVERDLWKDFGDATITGIAPTAMGGTVLFDRVELRSGED